ncbi:hypothetical protein CYR83_02705 [Ligilactobacillus agilis]|uniref:Uncharacterized protein n=1 Tax=Ligilactobacillus agilis TaxID=1601 RepID=A0A2I2AAJ5_9LACO|nr:hypothetical protein CYR79_06370 [Ligilactobacillus agilis]PLA83604.1 hypothetical protein CYR83_02705 [Ligilactobacillus agilis]
MLIFNVSPLLEKIKNILKSSEPLRMPKKVKNELFITKSIHTNNQINPVTLLVYHNRQAIA